VQALLLGHYPLKAQEMSALSDGLLGLIELGLAATEKNRTRSHEAASNSQKLRFEAWGLEASPAKVAILEQAVQLADSLEDLDEGVSPATGVD